MRIHLNGCRIGRGTAPCDVRYKPFDTYHVNLDPGEHILALLVHHVGETCATVMRSRPGVLVELEGDGFHVGSDASWKALLSKAHRADLPCMMSHFGFHIECDQRLIPHNWDSLLCDDSHWPCAQDLSGQQDLPWLALVARDCPRPGNYRAARQKPSWDWGHTSKVSPPRISRKRRPFKWPHGSTYTPKKIF